MLLGWALVAWGADEVQDRVELYDAMLQEALTGDLQAAALAYRSLSRKLPAEDPTRAEALLWLGRALYDLGEVEEARESLLDGIRSGLCPNRCRELLEIIEVDQESITATPTAWTFDQTDHGIFHPWLVQDLGSIKIATSPNGDPALEWSTTAQTRKPDRLVVGFQRPFPPPEEVRLTVTSSTHDALLQMLVEDEAGRRYGLPEALVVLPGAPRRITVPLRLLEPVEPADPPCDPATLWRLTLVDLTGNRATGPNTLWIHDFEVR